MRHYANLWDTPFFMMWILLNEDGPYILGWFLILSGKWYTKRVMTVPKIQYLVKWSLSQRKVNVFCKVTSYWQNICAHRLKRSPIKSSSFTWPKVKRIIENSTCAKEEKIINCKEWGKRAESPKWLIFFVQWDNCIPSLIVEDTKVTAGRCISIYLIKRELWERERLNSH